MRVFAPAHCAAVIPCYNESAAIAALVPAVSPHVAAVLVIDDGSADETARLAQSAGAQVFRHECNLGKGAALKTGLSHARRNGFEWAVTLDGDGQHAPADLPLLFQCAEKTGAHLVVGNRMHAAQDMCWLRRQVNRWMSRRLSLRAGRSLPDTQSGLRLIHLPTWAAMPHHAERFQVESEVLMAFLAAGKRVEFVPIQVRAALRDSHVHPLTDTVRWFKWWWSAPHQNGTGSVQHTKTLEEPALNS